MAFADEVVKDGRGVVYRLDVSLDSFATIAYRYSDRADIDATYEYDNRIVSLGRLTRGLGVGHVFEAGNVDVVLANDDEGVDWMVDAGTATNVLRARARLYVGLFDPADMARPPTIAWRQLGEFVFDGFPQRSDETVRVTLADDSLGFLDGTVLTPTAQDLYDQDTNPHTNPLRRAPYSFWANGSEKTPVPLSWGANIHRAAGPFNVGTPGQTVGLICATTSSAAVTSADAPSIYVTFRSGFRWPMPSSWTPAGSSLGVGQQTLWSIGKSAAITKNGKTFYVLWIYFIDRNITLWLFDLFRKTLIDETAGVRFSQDTAVIDDIHVFQGMPLSARTASTTLSQHGADVIADIITHYSRADSTLIDAASFARVKAALGSAYHVAGSIHAADQQSLPTLRDELSAIAASSDFDVFMRWDGKLGLSCRTLDYNSQTDQLTSIDETRIANFSDAIPRDGQRGAPYNRLRYGPARETPFVATPTEGPFDDPSGTLASWGRTIEREIDRSWVEVGQMRTDPWTYRNVTAEIRPVVTFTTDLEALNLELGDYFKLTYTRNLGDPYSETIFQVESLALDPSSNTVEVTALYCGDLRTDRPYLLDNETLQVVATGSGARTVTVTDGEQDVTFSSGDLTNEDVREGDFLILKDTTEATTGFTRNRAVSIVSVQSGTMLRLDSSDLDFDAPAGLAVSAWEIRRSWRTRNTLTGSNYPDGLDLYGAVADAATGGVYVDGFAAHKMLEG